MATWSRSQSQDAGSVRGISSGLKVSASSHLQRNERVRLANKKENARIVRWAEEAPTYKKIREYNHTIEVRLSRRVKRRVACISHAKRLEILQRASDREAFFAAI